MVSSLSYARGSGKIFIYIEIIKTLIERFGRDELEKLLKEYDIAGKLEALTEREGKYLAKYKTLDTIRDRFAQERQAGSEQILYSLLERESARLESLFVGLSVVDVTKAISPLITGSPYPVRVKQSVNNLPQRVQDDMRNAQIPGSV
jgi:hypothetical protein